MLHVQEKIDRTVQLQDIKKKHKTTNKKEEKQ